MKIGNLLEVVFSSQEEQIKMQRRISRELDLDSKSSRDSKRIKKVKGYSRKVKHKSLEMSL